MRTNYTEETFWAGIELLKKELPNSEWIPELQRLGYTFMSQRYLQAALESIPPKPVDVKPKVTKDDAFLNSLYNKKTRLFSKRAMTSNRLHICKDDDARAEVSDDIKAIQNKINLNQQDIDTYKSTGKLPVYLNEKYPVPDDPLQRHKKLNSLRASISRKRKDIKIIAALPDDHKSKSKKLCEAESKLSELETYKSHVEKAIG